MFVAADDTDSLRGNCTTFLASEIIRAVTDEGWDLIGCPRLVRLNPAIPWKTRGNGALVMEFGKGIGEKTFIGEISGKKIHCYHEKDGSEPDVRFLKDIIRPLVEKYHDPDYSDPGILITETRPDIGFYRKGVTRVMERSEVDAEIGRIGADIMEWGCGRGLIGCTCGTAWIPEDSTFELLTYRPPERWGTKREFDPSTIERAEHEIASSFNSWDDRHAKVAMVPATPCPVMYGFRADDIEDLYRGFEMIKTEKIERWLIFLTNQGTDDHIIMDPPKDEFIPDSSYAITGKVISAKRIRGGHTFLDLDTDYGTVTAGIYAPAEEFRYLLNWLVPGDKVRVYGELRREPRTLNIEKIQVLELAEKKVRLPNPKCPQCGKSMKSIGKDEGFRCRRCGTKAEAGYRTVPRSVALGWYEPPAEARRHLSKPLKRMSVQQPAEFLRGNTLFDD